MVQRSGQQVCVLVTVPQMSGESLAKNEGDVGAAMRALEGGRLHLHMDSDRVRCGSSLSKRHGLRTSRG